VTRQVVWTFLMVAAAQPALAQGRTGGAGRPARDEVFRMVEAYVVSNLQENLGLTDEQFVKLLPLVKRLQGDRRDYAEKRRQTLGEMRRLLESGSSTEPRIADLVDRLRVLEVEGPAALRRDLDAVDAVLTPLQQAKFRLIEARVEQRIRELMARARAQGGGGRRRGGDGALPEAGTP